MPVRAIDHINIRASKTLVSELKDFYESVLGLQAGWRPPFKSTGHWLYLDGLPIVHLVEDEKARSSEGSRGAVIDHISFACAGLQEFVGLLEARNIPFRRSGVPGTSLVQLFLADPAGNGVELQFSGDDA